MRQEGSSGETLTKSIECADRNVNSDPHISTTSELLVELPANVYDNVRSEPWVSFEPPNDQDPPNPCDTPTEAQSEADGFSLISCGRLRRQHERVDGETSDPKSMPDDSGAEENENACDSDREDEGFPSWDGIHQCVEKYEKSGYRRDITCRALNATNFKEIEQTKVVMDRLLGYNDGIQEWIEEVWTERDQSKLCELIFKHNFHVILNRIHDVFLSLFQDDIGLYLASGYTQDTIYQATAATDYVTEEEFQTVLGSVHRGNGIPEDMERVWAACDEEDLQALLGRYSYARVKERIDAMIKLFILDPSVGQEVSALWIDPDQLERTRPTSRTPERILYTKDYPAPTQESLPEQTRTADGRSCKTQCSGPSILVAGEFIALATKQLPCLQFATDSSPVSRQTRKRQPKVHKERVSGAVDDINDKVL
jgi:hypothetical protein